MEVLLNGDAYSVEQNSNLLTLIETLNVQGKFAIELNHNIIPRSEYSNTSLQSGDNIEIVQAIGGG